MSHTATVMPRSSAMRDWSSYNRAQVGRLPRELVQRALAVTGPSRGRRALDLGSGVGVEAEYLAQRGWHVSAIEPDPSAAPHLRALAIRYPIQHIHDRLEELKELPPAGLIHSSFALPYIPQAHFPRVWSMMRTALEPDGILAVDLFGEKDEWAHINGTFVTHAQVLDLVAGLEIIDLVEENYDGQAFSGPKRWHTFQVLARQP